MNESDRYYTQPRSEMIAFLPTNFSKMLEIGCGNGRFTKQIDKQVEKWGIEINEQQAINAKKHFSKILIGAVEKVGYTLPDDYFDLVICNDVIEHVADHDALFELLKRIIKRPGYLVGSVPNVRYYNNLYHILIKRDWQYQNHGIRDRTHLRYFTEKSLKRTLVEHEFQIELFNGLHRANIITTKPKSWLKNIIFHFLSIMFSGKHNDIQYSQFAFRARL